MAETTENMPNVHPVDLERMARSIAQAYGDKGAIIITVGKDGVRVGIHGLDAREIQDALCVGLFYNFVKDADD
jgi:hypothetical protein